jgi:hypothetical protein
MIEFRLGGKIRLENAASDEGPAPSCPLGPRQHFGKPMVGLRA